jgi:hypothetical protein
MLPNTLGESTDRRAAFRPQLSVDQRARVSVVGCITLFTTYSPILRPMSVPTRVENR